MEASCCWVPAPALLTLSLSLAGGCLDFNPHLTLHLGPPDAACVSERAGLLLFPIRGWPIGLMGRGGGWGCPAVPVCF